MKRRDFLVAAVIPLLPAAGVPTNAHDGSLRVNGLLRISRELLPALNRDEDIEHGEAPELIDELKRAGIRTESAFRSLLLKNRGAAIYSDSQHVSSGSYRFYDHTDLGEAAIYTAEDWERAKRRHAQGVYLTHAGMIRSIIFNGHFVFASKKNGLVVCRQGASTLRT